MKQPRKRTELKRTNIPISRNKYNKNIAIVVINVVLFSFMIATIVLNSRETQIVRTEKSIDCEIIKLDCTSTSRQHPSAVVSYKNTNYNVGLNNCNDIKIGRNINDFYYDSYFNRIFVKEYVTKKMLYLSIVLFAISFLLWFLPKDKL